MARKGKVGLDYFSHDVDILQDKKIKILKAKHGLIGYAVFLRLLEELYRDNGYYLHIDEDFDILFSDENNIDYNVYINILNDCINKGLFDKEMYDQYQILTSARIQTNYCNATERRKSVEFIKEYLLIEVTEIYNSEKVDVNIISLNVDINEKNENIGTQSKVKESKVKENKEENNLFEFVWKKYPNKKGKGSLSKTKIKFISENSEELCRCIDRYTKYVENRKKTDFPDLKYQNGSTFFNSGYVDYLDENYTEIENKNGGNEEWNMWD